MNNGLFRAVMAVGIVTWSCDFAVAEDTMESAPPIQCEANESHETQYLAICGFNDASAPNPATMRCFNYYDRGSSSCQRKCIFEKCE